MNRKDILLAGIDLANATGLEIGALCRPLILKSEGDVRYVDYADRAFLQKHYAGDPNVDLDAIVETDYIWGEQSLAEITGGAKFDYIVASHVIEHVPDLITWLNELKSVLKPDGTIRLAIPDRRFTFDFLRRETVAADVVDAYLKKARRPQPWAVFDFTANFTEVDNAAIWRGDCDVTALKPLRPFDEALALARAVQEGSQYHDVHCWVFTGQSFARLLSSLATGGVLSLACDQFTATRQYQIEFFASLRHARSAGDAASSWAMAERIALAGPTAPFEQDPRHLPTASDSPAGADAEVAALKREIRQLSYTIDAMRASTSWRVTTPMRTAVNGVHSVRRMGKAVQTSMRYRGGLGPMARNFIDSVREHGLREKIRMIRGASVGATTTDSPPQKPLYVRWMREQTYVDRQAVATIGPVLNSRPVQFDKPLFSVLMPTYNPPHALLRAAVQSVREQVFADWELCIVDDASTDAAIAPLLAELQRDDPRIHVKVRPQNGHISAASNDALAMARGDFIALLDHDDLLHPMALFWMAEEIRQHPDADLIYSDEDKIDERGERSDPYFKSDFNPELFHNQNMISHLGVYRRELVTAAGAFREGMEGAQDYDLALRVIESTTPARIRHVPKVLYHWRIHAESTAMASAAKPYAYVAGMRALQEHFERTGVAAEVLEAPEAPATFYRVKHRLPEPLPSVELIIPTRDRAELLKMAVGSVLAKSTYRNYRICIVDNGSVDRQALALMEGWRQDPRIRIIRDESPFNFSALNNQAAESSDSDYICLLNNDVEILTPEWIEEMVGMAIQPGIGCVGARLWYPDGRLQHGGVVIGVGGVAGHSHKFIRRGQHGYFGRAILQQAFSAVTAACLLIKRSIYLEVGGMDTMLQVAFNDVDFCLRVREAGYRNVWTPYAELVHHESVSRGFDDEPVKAARFQGEVERMMQRWGPALHSDPYYSPHLSMTREDFSITDR